jgi:sulfatase maturation enzyme AslB (radical SAM superfamily)
MDLVASSSKVAYHRDRLDSYVRGEGVFPVTMELDITSRCTRLCNDCPSSRSGYQHALSLDFVHEIMSSLEGQTRGLLLTGGEATMSPIFPDVLALARRKGFVDIAIVTNGSLLDKKRVSDALLEHASTIRVSMYDWTNDSCEGAAPTLAKIANLRKRIDDERAKVRIGISVLTNRDRIGRLPELMESVREAGAHWVYFHPMCAGWDNGRLVQADQTGVPEMLQNLVAAATEDFGVFWLPARYDDIKPSFSGYHAAHFLLIVGADGRNYLGAEVKYQERFAIADVSAKGIGGFLRDPDRLRRIEAVRGPEYSARGGLHRGVLYSHFIEGLINRSISMEDPVSRDNGRFSFPHIL